MKGMVKCQICMYIKTEFQVQKNQERREQIDGQNKEVLEILGIAGEDYIIMSPDTCFFHV